MLCDLLFQKRNICYLPAEMWPRAAFSTPKSQFFTIRTDPLSAVYQRFVKNLRNEQVTHILNKERCEQTFFDVHLVAFMSPVKFANIVFVV